MLKFGIFDTETTGLPFHRDAALSLQPKIIEFGGIITDGTDILSTTEFICNPGVKIEPIITQITGLTNDDLADKPSFDRYIGDLTDYFSACDVIITHNLSFDKAMVKYDLQRRDLELADVAWTDQLEVCTVEQTFHQYGRRMRLIELTELLVGPYVQKHRAIDDVKLLLEVCRKINLFEAIR